MAHSMRPVREIRIWNSGGLTQADFREFRDVVFEDVGFENIS